jgi:hydrogenase maturation protease
MAACKPSAPRRRPRILVAGLGNLLLQDDGVGVHAVRALHHGVPRGVRAVEVGTAVLDALYLVEWADRILAIDAMAAGGAPGTIYRFGIADVAEAAVKASLHEVDLVAALRFLTNGHRPEIAVLGVEPATIGAGLELSPSVQAAMPRLVTAAQDIVTRWRA